MRAGATRHAAAVLYVGVAAGLAVTGGMTQTPAPLLADVVWTLPTGVAALMSIYLVYGLAAQVGPALGAAATNRSGSTAQWLNTVNAAYTVVAFTAAAAVNVAIIRLIRRRRSVAASTRTAAYPHPPIGAPERAEPRPPAHP